MKKQFVKLLSVLLAVVTLISVSACSLFKLDRGSIDNLPSSSELINNVGFGTGDEGAELPSAVESLGTTRNSVIESVRRSVVAIFMKTEDGSASAGSGIIVDIKKNDEYGNPIENNNEFYVLTCNHVIDGLGTIVICVPDAEGDNAYESDYNETDYSFSGIIGNKIYNDQAVTLVGGDNESDVALLKVSLNNANITINNICKAKFPTSTRKTYVGEEVIAIGNPSGVLPGTVTCGTISYLNREITVEGRDMTLTQLNVDIFNGSSGGGLFNLYGELIGMSNAGSTKYIGIGYAIPFIIDSVNGASDNGFISIAGQLLATATSKNYGYVTGRKRAFGFTIVSSENVVTIKSVTEGGLAQAFGLLANDKILKVKKGELTKEEFANVPSVTSIDQIDEIIIALNVGESFTFLIERNVIGVGAIQKVVSMKATQYIFCDTGWYPVT